MSTNRLVQMVHTKRTLRKFTFEKSKQKQIGGTDVPPYPPPLSKKGGLWESYSGESPKERDDTEFCRKCNVYLFTDMPEDQGDIMCQGCTAWFCATCGHELGLSPDDSSSVDECVYCLGVGGNPP